MAHRQKAKSKRRSQKNTDKEQSERFIETARILESDETGKVFSRAFETMLKVSRVPSRKNSPKQK